LDAYFYNNSGVYDKVDAYLCPSEFLLNKFKQFNFQPHKLRLTNYCYDIASIDKFVDQREALEVDEQEEKFVLYVGRIEKLKGILTLIRAVEGTSIVLKIAGTGSFLDEAKRYVRDNEINNISFLGFQNKEVVYDLTIRSICVVCPSEWYENYPFSIIESLLLSTPVVGSTMGGIPELVLEGKTGFLHEPGDFLTLRLKILLLWEDELLRKQLGSQAREFAYSKVNFTTHWHIIKKIIEELRMPNNNQLNTLPKTSL
jgi:glycosyltransferase involved in cell wall biosynthesis